MGQNFDKFTSEVQVSTGVEVCQRCNQQVDWGHGILGDITAAANDTSKYILNVYACEVSILTLTFQRGATLWNVTLHRGDL